MSVKIVAWNISSNQDFVKSYSGYRNHVQNSERTGMFGHVTDQITFSFIYWEEKQSNTAIDSI